MAKPSAALRIMMPKSACRKEKNKPSDGKSGAEGPSRKPLRKRLDRKAKAKPCDPVATPAVHKGKVVEEADILPSDEPGNGPARDPDSAHNEPGEGAETRATSDHGNASRDGANDDLDADAGEGPGEDHLAQPDESLEVASETPVLPAHSGLSAPHFFAPVDTTSKNAPYKRFIKWVQYSERDICSYSMVRRRAYQPMKHWIRSQIKRIGPPTVSEDEVLQSFYYRKPADAEKYLPINNVIDDFFCVHTASNAARDLWRVIIIQKWIASANTQKNGTSPDDEGDVTMAETEDETSRVEKDDGRDGDFTLDEVDTDGQ